MKKVMLADSSAAFCAQFQLKLRDYGEFEFAGAFTDGERVLSAVKDEVPDILVLDLMLPKMDGLEVLRKISTMQTRPAVIAISNFVTDYVALETARLGVNYLLLKPLDFNLLMERLQEFSGTETNAAQ